MKIVMKNIRSVMISVLVSLFIVSCNDPAQKPTPTELSESKAQINQLGLSIANDISKNGPMAWLNYFENSPEFYMASNGDLAFKDYQSARSFVTNVLVKTISKINLKWSNIRVDTYSPDWGAIAADFHEDITDASGKTIPVSGYFTAVVHKTSSGWMLHNLHWSIKPAN